MSPTKAQNDKPTPSESESYYDSEESEYSDDEEVYIDRYPPLETMPDPTPFLFKLDTSHKDFIRSLVQISDSMFLTASEDKMIKMFYF